MMQPKITTEILYLQNVCYQRGELRPGGELIMGRLSLEHHYTSWLLLLYG